MKEESVDIKIRKRTKSIREIEREHRKETSEYMRLRREYMRGTHRTRRNEERRPIGLGSSKSIEELLDEAFG